MARMLAAEIRRAARLQLGSFSSSGQDQSGQDDQL